jgi:hypothetical protein
VKIINNSVEKIINFAAQYQEVLIDGKIHFIAIISKISDLEGYSGHVVYDCEGLIFNSEGKCFPELGKKATFELNNLIKFNNGLKII